MIIYQLRRGDISLKFKSKRNQTRREKETHMQKWRNLPAMRPQY